MSAPQLPAMRVGEGETRITVGVAALTWLVCWLGGNLLGGLAIAATGRDAAADDAPVWLTLIGATALWIPVIIGLRELSTRFGAGSFARDYGLAFQPIDLLGIPIGVLSQLVVIRLIYWPLQETWPDTFNRSRVEESARTLYENADGAWLVVLVVIVVVGAPMIEELLYRGLLQGAFVRRVNDVLAVVVVAGWFTVIHLRPIEYPGLFAFGLVVGVCALLTRRLGMGICAHLAFNATGLVWVATQ